MHDTIHLANIVVHVFLGGLALGLGLWILFRAKGDRPHRRSGRLYTVLMAGVVATAALGIAFFRRDPTLATITLLVSYELFSGVRSAAGKKPTVIDTVLAVAAAASGTAFLAYLMGGASAFWRPQITFPIGATLVLVAGYDLARLAAPRWRSRNYPLEHGVKMIMTLGALASAGLGTIATQCQPFSQIGPSIVFSLFALGYVLFSGAARHAKPSTSSS